MLTGEEGVGKLTILNLFPGENILEIDLDLNEILKKTIDIIELKEIEQFILKVIELKELINNLKSYKKLLQSINIICVVTNSTLTNVEKSQNLLLKLKQEIQNVDYYIIANFQDRKGKVIEIEKIEEIFGEKTFGFSAVQKDSKDEMISIINEILRKSIIEKEKRLPSKYDTLFLEIEEAKILVTRGECSKAAKIFASVASQFKNLYLETVLKQEKEEVDTLYHLCKAWEYLAYAEEKGEAKNFIEAANHFKQASESIAGAKLKFLALGNSDFCNALKLILDYEKEKQFKINIENYQKITTMIRRAAELYKKGGLKKEARIILTTLSYFDTLKDDLKNT
ncbi:MAG: hypothetical protein ACFE9I_14680 [Candidatus Hermodarchaeota archaeon]